MARRRRQQSDEKCKRKGILVVFKVFERFVEGEIVEIFKAFAVVRRHELLDVVEVGAEIGNVLGVITDSFILESSRNFGGVRATNEGVLF